MGVGGRKRHARENLAIERARRDHFQRHFRMDRGDHRTSGNDATVFQAHALCLAVCGHDFRRRRGQQDLAAQFRQPRCQRIRQRLHAADGATQAKAMNEAEQRKVNARGFMRDRASGAEQAAQRRLRDRMREAFHDGGVSGAGDQGHDLGLEVAIPDQGFERFPFRAEIALRGVDTHHRQGHVDEGIDQFHQCEEFIGIGRRKATDLGSRVVRIAPEHERMPVRVQVGIARRHLDLLEAVPFKLQLLRHHRMGAQGHQVQCAGMHEVLRRFWDQVAARGHAADLVARLDDDDTFAGLREITGSGQAVMPATDNRYIIFIRASHAVSFWMVQIIFVVGSSPED